MRPSCALWCILWVFVASIAEATTDQLDTTERSGRRFMRGIVAERVDTQEATTSPGQTSAFPCPSPTGSTQIYFAALGTGAGTGTSSDPFDGLNFRLDTLLRVRVETGVENLVVCIGPGTYPTDGAYDYVMYVGHTSGTPRGFSIGKGWKIYGAGKAVTTLLLVNLFAPQPANPGFIDTQTNRMITSYTDAVEGIEIANITIDLNYRAMKTLAVSRGYPGVSLEAMFIRSDNGNNWIHDVDVKNLAGEYGENFPIALWSLNGFPGPSGFGDTGTPATNNIIERVNVTGWYGGAASIITIVNGTGEIRDCVVDFSNGVNAPAAGFTIAIGGQYYGNTEGVDPAVVIHRNKAFGTDYGTNNDTWKTRNVLIQQNVFIVRKFGSVIGGGYAFEGFVIRNNTILLPANGIGVVFQGGVTSSLIIGNTIMIRGPGAKDTSVKMFGPGNERNVVLDNTVYHTRGACECLGVWERHGAGTNGVAVKIVGSGNGRNAVLNNTVYHTSGVCECSGAREHDGSQRATPESP